MTSSDWITIIGTIVTIAGTAITIAQAKNALKSSQAAKKALTTVQLTAVAERLKSAQEHIRDVAPDKVSQRGFKLGTRFDIIRREFDSALNSLPKMGKGSEAREQLANAQVELNSYHSSLSASPDFTTWEKLQVSVQDTISDLTSMTLNLGEANDK